MRLRLRSLFLITVLVAIALTVYHNWTIDGLKDWFFPDS